MFLFYLFLFTTILALGFCAFFTHKLNFIGSVVSMAIFIIFAFGTTMQAALNGML